jgi:hypothetical protein
MIMATINVDCNIALIHPDVNSGQPYGFLLDDSKDEGPAVSIQREMRRDEDSKPVDTAKYFFTVLIGDGLRNPDGTPHAGSAQEMYTALLDYLSRRDALAIETGRGTFTGLYPAGHFATETHFPHIVLVSVQLCSEAASFHPADLEKYIQSLWVDDTYAGQMDWSNSYWRV